MCLSGDRKSQMSPAFHSALSVRNLMVRCSWPSSCQDRKSLNTLLSWILNTGSVDKELHLKWGKPKAKPWCDQLTSSCRREPGEELTAREDRRCPDVLPQSSGPSWNAHVRQSDTGITQPSCVKPRGPCTTSKMALQRDVVPVGRLPSLPDGLCKGKGTWIFLGSCWETTDVPGGLCASRG